MNLLKGRIVRIEKKQNCVTYIKQGIQGPDQYKYDKYPGGNGTYITGGEYLGTSLNVEIYVYDLGKSFTFDIYEDIKCITGKCRISASLLKTIESHEGEKIDVVVDNNQNVGFNPIILLQ